MAKPYYTTDEAKRHELAARIDLWEALTRLLNAATDALKVAMSPSSVVKK